MTLYEFLRFIMFSGESFIQKVNFKSLKLIFFIDLGIWKNVYISKHIYTAKIISI